MRLRIHFQRIQTWDNFDGKPRKNYLKKMQGISFFYEGLVNYSNSMIIMKLISNIESIFMINNCKVMVEGCSLTK
jgi:hypothetical protein